MRILTVLSLLFSLAFFTFPVYSQDQKTPQISLLRPRIFVRADGSSVGSGLTLSALRSRMKDPEYRKWISYDGEPGGWETLPAIAMQYLLRGEKKLAMSVGEYLSNTSFPLQEHTSTAAAVYFSAIAFDWVREALPQEMVNKITARLAEGAEHLKVGILAPAINHNYTIVSLHGVAMAALAIYGEGQENTQRAVEYMKMVDHILAGDQMLFETFKQKKGTWGEGNHYSPFVVYFPFLMTIRGMATATGTDYFEAIRNKYENFLRPMAKFVIANFRPDFTLERIGDVTPRVAPGGTFMRPLIELLAAEIRDSVLEGQVRSFSNAMEEYYGPNLTPDVYGWMMMVNYDSKLPQTPSYKTLPLAMRLGGNTYEHIMLRNNWEENGTLITYISGDHYTDHQHFDKGHFLIYKNGGLVIDGGGYSAMYGDHWSNYSTRTLAHNNVLIHDPLEHSYQGIGNTEIFPDGGQRIIRGLQNHKNWTDYENIRKDSGLNTASVLAFETDPKQNTYNYVKSNLTKAYGDKTIWTDRQLLYLPHSDYLVVRDRVITRKSLDKYWLLHFQAMPDVDGKAPGVGITGYNGASVVRAVRTGDLKLDGKTVSYSGGLFIKSLLPAQRTISVIGGPGYEYYNRFVNKNFPPEKPFAPLREAGNWRMEVSPASPSAKTVFLHALEITDEGKKEMVPVTYINSSDNKMNGAHFMSAELNYITLFSSSMDERGHEFQQVKLPVSYSLRAKAHTNHILVELEPGTRVTVTINEKRAGTFTVSKAGVLSFTDEGTGLRKVVVTKE